MRIATSSSWLAMLLGTALAVASLGTPGRPRWSPRESTRARIDGRRLDGHYFLPSQLVPDPFVNTWFNAISGFGYATASSALGGRDLFTDAYMFRKFQLAALSQEFGIQVGVLRGWALRLSASGMLFSAINESAAAGVGAVLTYNVRGGTVVSFRFAHRYRIGASFDVDYGPSYRLDIFHVVTQSLIESRVDLSGLIVGANATTILPGVAAALALHRSLGLTLSAQYAHAFASGEEARGDHDCFLFGGALSFDLHALTPVPLGAVAGYRITVPLGGEVELSHEFSAGLFYTGRADLVLGPEMAIRLFPLTRDLDLDAKVLRIVMRYYW